MNSLPFAKTEAVKIKVLAVKQPIGEFYVGVAKANDIISFCSANERVKKDKLEEYIGIQRPLNSERVEEIKKYVQTWDASFPNSVILAINHDYFFFEGENIYIKKDKDAANIIDGQHRLAGFDDKTEKNFDVILAIFPELELEEQAYLFSVINTKMTRINPSLAQDLYEFTTINTPEKLAHNIAKTFNQEINNPWYDKIKMLGKKEPGSDSVLSQSTFTREIVKLICDRKDSYEIRHIIKVGNNKRSSLRKFYDAKTTSKFVLWEPFVENEDKFIFTILKDYFLAAKEVYADDWDNGSKILTKTTGYTALMLVFDKLCRKGFESKKLTKNFFKDYFESAKASRKVQDFTSANYNPGGMGERNLARNFLEGMGLSA